MPNTHLISILKELTAKQMKTKYGNHYLLTDDKGSVVDCDARKVPNMELHFGDVKVVMALEDYAFPYHVSSSILSFA